VRPRALALFALAAASACERGPDPAARGGALRSRYRSAQRAYDGAPPVVPHAVASLGRQDCLNCHREGMDLEDAGIAARSPHPERVSCQQCHVEQLEPRAVFVASGFTGWRHPRRGSRAYPGAPPTLPHPRNGREGCLGCHGEGGGSPIRTPHADRINCLQCHVEQDAGATAFVAHAFARPGGEP
jgi:cytochrome c-type protein NapB